MRLSLSLSALLLLSTPVWAEDFVLRADIASATIYGQGADMTRRVTVALPVGQHRLILPARDVGDMGLATVTGPEGIRIGLPDIVDRWTLAEGALDSAREASARAAVAQAEAGLQEAEDSLAQQATVVSGHQTQLTYLMALARGGAEGAAMPADPAALMQILSTLGSETTRVAADLQAAQAALRPLEESVADARLALDQAQRALQDLTPFGRETPALTLDVDVEQAMEATFEISYFSRAASWQPSYRLDLDSDTGALRIERFITVNYDGSASLRDVEMRFSTATPLRQRDPSEVYPAPARIHPSLPAPVPLARGGVAAFSDAQAMMEPMVMVESAAALEVDGLSLVYAYQTPVTLGASGTATLPFDDLTLDMDLENRAVPRRDQTAFLVAMGANDSGEPLLPGEAVFYRDGALIAEAYLPMIASGAEVEMGFGPLDHLRLNWQDISRNEGDRGLFVTSSEQSRRITFGVENTSDRPENVRLLYATPFSEQEDLELDVALSLAPDDRDIDDLRGVHAWDLEVAPGAERTIEMAVELSWPEDQVLDWRP